MYKFTKTILVVFSLLLLFAGCSDDDDFQPGSFWDNALIYLTVNDAQGNAINDSAQLAAITNYRSDETALRNTYTDPFLSEKLEKIDGQWMYLFVLNPMRENTEYLPGDNNFLLRDTLVLGKAQYALEETLHNDLTVKGSNRRSDYSIVSLKINGREATNARKLKTGYWITLQAE